MLDRALNSIASIYRDVAVLQNNAEDSVGLINLENRSSITDLSVRLTRGGAVRRLEDIAVARRRLAGNGNPVLVFEALLLAPSLVRVQGPASLALYCFPACGFLQRVGKWLFGCMILACYCAITVSKIAKSDSALVVGGFADDELRRE